MIGTLPTSPVAIDQARLWNDHWRISATYPTRMAPVTSFSYICDACDVGEHVAPDGGHECWNCGSPEHVRRA